jgi:hypothetical protein
MCRAPETSNERVHYRFLSTTGYYLQHSKIQNKFLLIHLIYIINYLLILLLDIYILYYYIYITLSHSNSYICPLTPPPSKKGL